MPDRRIKECILTTANNPTTPQQVSKASVMEVRFWRARQELMKLVLKALGGEGSTDIVSFDLIEIKPGTWVTEDERLWLEAVTFTFGSPDGTDAQFTLVNRADGKLRWTWGANPGEANTKHLPQETVYWLNHISMLISQALGRPDFEIQKFIDYRENAREAWERKNASSEVTA